MAAYGYYLQNGCGCRSSASFCSYDVLQLSSSSIRHPQQLKLRFLPLAFFSSSITIDPLLQTQGPRDETSLHFTLPSLTTCRTTERWICFAAGGKRPRRPRVYKSRHRRGSFNKSDKLLESLESVSNVKEEVYAVLDGFVAWELDFPLVSVKKALAVLERAKNWPRIIQIIKWMLGKGQGRSLGTYSLLLEAFSEEGRIDEAQELFKKVFAQNLECTPLKMFSEIMKMYERHKMYEDILEVFADMEELNVRLDAKLSDIVSGTYVKIGESDRAYRVRLKYSPPKYRWRTINGLPYKFRNEDRDVAVSRWTRDNNRDNEMETESGLAVSTREDDPSEYKSAVHGHFSEGKEGGMVTNTDLRDFESAYDDEEEDSRDYDSADDQELEIVEDEDPQHENDPVNEVYFRHLHARNEMYV